MEINQLNRLKTLLSVPSKTYEEEQMVEFITDQLEKMDGVHFYRDVYNNVYATKGELEQDEFYPMFIAHTDTVHYIVPEIVVKEEMLSKPYTYGKSFNDDHHKSLKGYTTDGTPTGIGGDDKVGVFLALELLMTLPKVKVGLFVAEETGCHGSSKCDINFLKDVGYAIQFDAPGDHLITRICWGVKLYDDNGDFIKVARSTFESWMNTTAQEQTHPYTDVSKIKEKADISCINFSCGYYNMHSANEFVVIDDVENSFMMAKDLVNKFGYKKYEHKPESHSTSWKDYGYYSPVSDICDDEGDNVVSIEVGTNVLTFDLFGLSITNNHEDKPYFDEDQMMELYLTLKEYLNV
jgi:putative aminopeptidase FrvX